MDNPLISTIIISSGLLFPGCGETQQDNSTAYRISRETIEVSRADTYSGITVRLAASASKRLEEAYDYIEGGEHENAVQNLKAYSRMCSDGISRTLTLGRTEKDFHLSCRSLTESLNADENFLLQMQQKGNASIGKAINEALCSVRRLKKTCRKLCETFR